MDGMAQPPGRPLGGPWWTLPSVTGATAPTPETTPSPAPRPSPLHSVTLQTGSIFLSRCVRDVTGASRPASSTNLTLGLTLSLTSSRALGHDMPRRVWVADERLFTYSTELI